MKYTNAKNKLNKIMQIAETLAAVYIYIYIWGLSISKKTNVKYAENIKFNMNLKKYEDRTMLKIGNIGLSLCLFKKIAKRDGGFLQFLANRDGPKMF